MSRLIQSDYKELIEFISSYSLSRNVENTEYIRLLSEAHKKYYALLIFLSELVKSGFTEIETCLELTPQANIYFQNYLKESISDLGSSLFDWIHGSYKASRLQIRCSIENFIRGLCSTEDPHICELDVTFRIFEEASNLSLFTSQSKRTDLLRELKGKYSELCDDVHTANIEHMQHLSALNYFPGFDHEQAEQTTAFYNYTAVAFLSLLCLCFRQTFLKMHPSNSDIIISVLPPDTRELIHNPS